MGKPMMIQDEDNQKIEILKKKLGTKTKIEVLRRAILLLEQEVAKSERVRRWQKAVKAVGSSGLNVLHEFQHHHRFKKI